MKLITPELIKRFNEVGDQSEVKNPLIIAKFFNPCGSQTWYATEYSSETTICYGYVTGMWEDEWGTFSIDELKSLKLPFGMSIERDIHFKEKTFEEQIPQKRTVELNKINLDKDSNQELER